MKPILEIQQISKKYQIEGNKKPYLSLRENIFSFLKPTDKKQEFWALRDVSFNVSPGDTVGIIGKNGAGKSTLLKILSKITPPTSGRILARGRIASLLEVGTGFHSELSGRENVFMNGSILGMRKSEIEKQFDEIVAFSGVEKFLDTPLKHYSSGMQLRLAFAVAAFLEPEILVIDEVLAVGDAEFQKKCLNKMEQVSKSGRTILFVSHNFAAIQNLCKRSIVLKNGELVHSGNTAECIDYYLGSEHSNASMLLTDRKDRKGNGKLKITRISLLNEKDEAVDTVFSGQNLKVVFDFQTNSHDVSGRLDNVVISLQVKNSQDIPIFLHHNRINKHRIDVTSRSGSFIAGINRLPLPAANYKITYSVIQDNVVVDMIEDALLFTVAEGDYFGSGEVPPASHGLQLVDVNWKQIPH